VDRLPHPLTIASKKLICGLAVFGAMQLCMPAAADTGSPRMDFLLYCSGCHHPSGEGKPPNVPTLHDELGRMMQVEEMRSYLLRVPGAADSPLSDAALAAVTNWILQEFNGNTLPDDFKPLTTEEVERARQQTLANPVAYRIQFWKDYEF